MQEMSPDGDWNCSEKGLACELAAKPIVAVAMTVHTPVIIPILPLNRGITCPEGRLGPWLEGVRVNTLCV